MCNSGKQHWAIYDARGIYVSKVCEDCEKEVKSHYRRDIFENSQYHADEQIEED